jgi:hypothetical protein
MSWMWRRMPHDPVRATIIPRRIISGGRIIPSRQATRPGGPARPGTGYPLFFGADLTGTGELTNNDEKRA